LFFRGKLIEESALRVKDKETTIYIASAWIAVQRVFWNLGRSKIGPSRFMEVIGELSHSVQGLPSAKWELFR